MTTSFLDSLDAGRLCWDELQPFPREDPAEREAGDARVAHLVELLAGQLDPEEVDRIRELPAGLVEALKRHGYFAMSVPPELGGLGLSPYHVFRLIEGAAGWSPTAGLLLGLQNTAGAPALLPALPPGPVRDFVSRRIAERATSGWADTEPAGHNNAAPGTTATPTADGTAYLLDGEKLFIGNGSIAELLVVTAVVPDPDRRRVCVCFVDTSSPGFSVVSNVDFVGFAGLPNGYLRFDGVRVPRDQVFFTAEDDVRLSPTVAAVAILGRHTMMATPAVAIARRCLEFSADFVNRRTIDGRPLGGYDQIQRIVAATLADIFAIESVVAWNLLGCALTDRWFERYVTKNIATLAAWRVADRTVSLFGGEGVETPASKRRRGVPALPVERLFRDARMLRVAGGVDFQADHVAGRLLLSRYYGPAQRRPSGTVADADPDVARDADLTPANRDHLRAAAAEIRRFKQTCLNVVARHHSLPSLLVDEERLVLLGGLARELLTMSVVLARAASREAEDGQVLADVYCVQARHRLDDLWRRLPYGAEPDYAKLSTAYLSGGS
ncbi:MAG: hypothetical protein AUI14_19995 [Actinobacteria bacterium 13_2_20CM_2_71_6]|nr:MAG: hypothetical protein AUI14_19995 [Actinobacteria bacterium 13_2_20CM_2_71_6]